MILILHIRVKYLIYADENNFLALYCLSANHCTYEELICIRPFCYENDIPKYQKYPNRNTNFFCLDINIEHVAMSCKHKKKLYLN